MKKWYLVTALVVFLLSILSLSWADPVIREIYFQKKTTLTYPKTYTFRFSLWTDETSTDLSERVWYEEQVDFRMKNATIKASLGSVTPLNLADFVQQQWVQVERYSPKIQRLCGHRDEGHVGIPKRPPPPPRELAVSYRREAKHVRLVSGLEEAHGLLPDWLDPVLAGTRVRGGTSGRVRILPEGRPSRFPTSARVGIGSRAFRGRGHLRTGRYAP